MATGAPRGNLSDLYPRWLGARELLLHGRDPYSPEVTREIQEGYYGRALDPNRAADPRDQQGFAYPVYVVFLLAPTVRLPFPLVQTGFRWLLILLTVISVPLWLRAAGQRTSGWRMMAWIIFVLGSFPAVQGIKLQQLTLLVCVLLAGAFAALAAGHLVLAGILLALATAKPQLVAIVLLWVLIWSIGEWRTRRPLFRGFAVTMLLLLTASNYVLPHWISRFREAAAQYLHYTGGGKSVLDVVLAAGAGKWVGITIVLMLLVPLWRLRRAPANGPHFALALALAMAATLVVIPTYAPYNQLLLIPSLMMVLGQDDPLWRRGPLIKTMASITALCVFWPWIAAAMLDVALLFYAPARVEKAWAIPLFTSLIIPLVVLGLTVILTMEALRKPPRSAA